MGPRNYFWIIFGNLEGGLTFDPWIFFILKQEVLTIDIK